MSAFWHWFVVGITIIFTAVMVWLFIATGKARVPSATNEEGKETTGHVWDEDLAELNNPMPRWWLWLFYLSVIFSLAYLALYPGLGRWQGALGWSSEGQYEAEMASATEAFNEAYGELAARPLDELARHPDAVRMGRNLFAHNCSTCHGSDARGAVGYPNLTDDHWIWGNSPDQIWTTIGQGRQAAMPGFAASLDEQQITRTAVYVQQLAGNEVDTAMATAGKRNFDMLCAACHGPDGTGNPMLGAPNLTAGVYTYGGDLDTIRETIRNGRQGMMPAQIGLLGEARARLVAAYVLSLSADGAGND
ncbi:cytochrome-c oxidase, cbb3-type subunit III [Wenzhouxiangella marina]|uniref:Cbb3-type cytochrome c oxidase subunit n=1 Tax=Wenzhouxiangella marina TaxID=1579979 RepID=A0A0K0XZP1_9GAMM|nr:cytochrome-c oxidase, cbb3-type subunit III [Wenzhouxiangella marina]AKS43107.1 cytochrome Cbb3 [Wenzhouxiangella marina]MBB6087208.1 cytochrome c oxidase cbb3-type subunit 3 [Wenzhouxiangella marina]